MKLQTQLINCVRWEEVSNICVKILTLTSWVVDYITTLNILMTIFFHLIIYLDRQAHSIIK